MGELECNHPLWRLFEQLRRRGLPLAPADLLELRQLLALGFGWTSRTALRDACRALWAKSRDEQELLDSLFEQYWHEHWVLPASVSDGPLDPPRGETTPMRAPGLQPVKATTSSTDKHVPLEVVARPGCLSAIDIRRDCLSIRPFVLVPQFALAYRDVAQTWRRLRRPTRFGPPTELDVGATIAQLSRTGVATPPVLVPRRRNTVRILLLVDCEGSMAPFHEFVNATCRAIKNSAHLANSSLLYFHDLPAQGQNDEALARRHHDLPLGSLDNMLAGVSATREGWLYRDSNLTEPVSLASVVHEHAGCHGVVVLSDAGAARGRNESGRVLDSLSFTLALRVACMRVVWMNPLPRERWRGTSAARLARHVSMFALDREGTHRAIDFLRGRPSVVDCPV